jgi:hypothetical protein
MKDWIKQLQDMEEALNQEQELKMDDILKDRGPNGSRPESWLTTSMALELCQSVFCLVSGWVFYCLVP